VTDFAISREAGLLRCCARGRPDFEKIRDIAAQAIDWSAFLSLAEHHSLASLCCRRLEDACPELVPPEIRAALQCHLQHDSERNLFLTGELLRILDRLSEGGVRALAFKGPVFAWYLYGHPGLRRFQDLDILVDRRDLERAIDLLGTLGLFTDPDDKTRLVPSAHEISLVRTAPPAIVDLHWDMAPPEMGLSLAARNLLPRATTVPVAGRPVLTFSDDDQLLLCAFHGGKHGWRHMAWLADLSALIETHPPDWQHLLAEARRKNLSRALFTGVRLAHDVLGTPVPVEIRKPLERDRASAASAKRARSILLSQPASGRWIFPREVGDQLGIIEGCSRKLGYLWRKITVPTTDDWGLAARVRPLRLMRKYAYRFAGLR
jgi:hypothetical protein